MILSGAGSNRQSSAPRVSGAVRRRAAAFALLMAAAVACFAQTGKVESIGAVSDPSVSEAVRKSLEAKGSKITLPDGGVIAELWLRQELPSQAKKDVPGASYPEFAESSFLGVISFPAATTDYRGDPIKAGTYTMRYELLPDDGNHLGVAPNRDFVLLIPAASDPDPTAVYKFDQLVNLSSQATGTRHPAAMSMVVTESTGSPAIMLDEDQHWVFSAKLRVGGGDVALGLILKGTAPQ